jgi:hypothetical protein
VEAFLQLSDKLQMLRRSLGWALTQIHPRITGVQWLALKGLAKQDLGAGIELEVPDLPVSTRPTVMGGKMAVK